MKKSHAMISTGVVLIALVVGLGFIAFHLIADLTGVTASSSLGLCPAGDRTPHRSWL